MSAVIYEATGIDGQLLELLDSKFALWCSELEDAGVESVWIAEVAGEIVGFLTVSIDGLCVAIESLLERQGIGTALVEESGTWRPEQDECPEFWEKMEEKFGW